MLVMHRRSRKLYKRYRRRSLAETAVSTVKRRAQKNELGLKDLSITARLPAKFGQPTPPAIEGRSPRVQTAFCADRALRAKAEGDGRGAESPTTKTVREPKMETIDIGRVRSGVQCQSFSDMTTTASHADSEKQGPVSNDSGPGGIRLII